jgi:hypothetical protein
VTKERSVDVRDQLTPREVAERTGFSYHAVLRAIDRGDLEAFEPIPGRLRIELNEYERWRRTPRRRRGRGPAGEADRGETQLGDGPSTRRRRTDAPSYRDELRAIDGGRA